MDNIDIDLIKKYLNGDEESLKKLIFLYTKPIYNFIYHICYEKDEANDITQETFLKVWKNLKKFDQNKNFKSWIFSIARNTAIDWVRKRKPLLFSRLDNEEDDIKFEENIKDENISQEEILIKKEELENKKDTVNEALKELSINQRSIILLKNNEGMTFEEIALSLGKPMNTIKSQYRRGLIILKKYIENAPKRK